MSARHPSTGQFLLWDQSSQQFQREFQVGAGKMLVMAYQTLYKALEEQLQGTDESLLLEAIELTRGAGLGSPLAALVHDHGAMNKLCTLQLRNALAETDAYAKETVLKAAIMSCEQYGCTGLPEYGQVRDALKRSQLNNRKRLLQEKLDNAVQTKDMNLLYGVYAEGKNIAIFDNIPESELPQINDANAHLNGVMMELFEAGITAENETMLTRAIQTCEYYQLVYLNEYQR